MHYECAFFTDATLLTLAGTITDFFIATPGIVIISEETLFVTPNYVYRVTYKVSN